MPTKAKAAFSARIRRTLEDLTIIRQTLLSVNETAVDSVHLSNVVLDLEVAGELKNVLDALRQVLWAYIQAHSSSSGRPINEILSWYKMELAVEMLRSVRAPTRATSAASSEPRFSFDDLVSEAIAVTSSHTKKEPTA
jgi:hypothetical protein